MRKKNPTPPKNMALAIRTEFLRPAPPSPAVATAQSLMHKAGLRAFLACAPSWPGRRPSRKNPRAAPDRATRAT